MKINWFNTKAAALAALGLIMPFVGMAADTKPTPPWRGIVSADDTSVFWVLATLGVLLLILIWVVASVTKGLIADKGLWKNKWGANAKNVAAIVGLTLVGGTSDLYAAETVASAPLFEMSDDLFWIMVVVDAFLAFVLFALLYNLNGLIASLRTVNEEEVTVAAEATVTRGFWEGSLSEAVPVELEETILMDHEYDGIRELDNKLPPWWLYMFYATIVFGFVYLGYYQFWPGHTQFDEYEAQMTEAAVEKEAYLALVGARVDETTATVLTGAAIENGKKTFATLCIACHAPSGGSAPNGVGPNLTDPYWIHGGGIKNIFKTIKYGVPTKGMISWESQLTPVQIQEVASYILSIQGSNPENAKEPQGEIWVETDRVDVEVIDTSATEISLNE